MGRGGLRGRGSFDDVQQEKKKKASNKKEEMIQSVTVDFLNPFI